MPKAKLSDEEKQAQFDTWKEGAEWQAVAKFMGAREKIKALEMSCTDISENYQPYLDALFEMVQDLKVPGRKAKSYEQMYCRTMFFEKCENIKIDGTLYDISNGAQVDMWNCKGAICEIYSFLDAGTVDMNCAFDTYQQWKKDLLKVCKEWDKLYVKHMKAIYPEMTAIHNQAMEPLNKLIDANVNYYRLEQMIKEKREVPIFRKNALELEFCNHFTVICNIFRDYGVLKDHFDIVQMMKTLKIEDWKIITPFAYYLTPLHSAITTVRDSLRTMHKNGPLMRKYIIEKNEDLQKQTCDMVKKDLVAQWLMGDELKQDQFKFFYDTVKIIYDCALREKLLAADPEVINYVIPKLIAYRALMQLRNVQMARTKAGLKNFEEKPDEEEEKKKEEEAKKRASSKSPAKKKSKKKEEEKVEELTVEQIVLRQMAEDGQNTMSEAQLAEKKEKDERMKYGRMWIWTGYFNEKNTQKWLDTAEGLKHINDHVLQDIEDAIILEGFKGVKKDKLKQVIEDDHLLKIQNTKKLMAQDADKYEEKAKADIKKRRFMNTLRPPYYWNFFEDVPEENKIPHVLRYDADPAKCYQDGRVEKIMSGIDEIGMNLCKYEEKKWEMLRKWTLEIFAHEYKQFKKQLDEN